jgi:tetratricopeptide (TPR) repeat protein
VHVVAGRQLGKTLLLARLAYDLARDGKRVYWSTKGQSRKALADPHAIRAFANLRSLRKRRLYLFLDDVISPEEASEGPESGLVEGGLYLDTLRDARITTVASCVQNIFPPRDQLCTIGQGDAGSSPFSITEPDIQGILSKWKKLGPLKDKKAEEFLKESHRLRIHRRRLFAFLCVLYEKAAEDPRPEFLAKHQFMAKFERDYRAVEKPELNILPIAACQILEVAVPARVVKAMNPDCSFAMDHSVVVRSRFEGDSDDQVCEMAGPYLGLWVLTKKQAKARFEDLQATYGALIQAAVKLENPGHLRSERVFLPFLLYRLARGFNGDLFGGRGEGVARSLFSTFRTSLEGYFQSVVERRDTSELIYWGRTFKSLKAWDLADRAYSAACTQLGSAPSLGDRLRLVNGLRALPRRQSREMAVPIIRLLLDQLVVDKHSSLELRSKVFHAYCELLDGLDRVAEAVELWDHYRNALRPDALLYMKLGTLYETLSRDRLSDAYSMYRSAVQAAELPNVDPQTTLNVLQRYAVFLARHVRAGWPRPHSIYRRALTLAHTRQLSWQPVVGAWALYQQSLGDYDRARRHYEKVVRSYQTEGVVEPHAWEGLANLLMKRARALAEHSPLAPPSEVASDLARAEHLCVEVIDDDFIDWRAKLYALHIRGRLVGLTPSPYEFGGKRRPNREEAVGILTSGFDSPEGLRDDPVSKTFQDAIVHKTIAEVYGKLIREKANAASYADPGVLELFQLQELHGRRSFEGLPRDDAFRDDVKAHVLHSRDWLAFFFWSVKRRHCPGLESKCLEEARKLYAENVEALESYGWGRQASGQPDRSWAFAYKLYLHFAVFLKTYAPTDRDTIRGLCDSFASCLPKARFGALGETGETTRRRLHSLCEYLVGKARELSWAGAKLEDVNTALALCECGLKMDVAWLERFPTDQGTQRSADRLRARLEELRGRIHA